jgi:hypothetical protein
MKESLRLEAKEAHNEKGRSFPLTSELVHNHKAPTTQHSGDR